ncbi:helical backbone metal receptor [Streptomyces sp. NPDC054838]
MRRIVSLVPSLTEAVAVSAPGLLVGVTDWCTHPADLGGAARIGGTKNPDVRAIIALRPDLVIANEEENRAPDLAAALRAAGVPVLVTEVRTLAQAFGEMDRVLVGALGLARPAWLGEAEAAWAAVQPLGPLRAVVPVWRRPWMVLGRDTFAGDLLDRLGVRNVHAGHVERYPRIAPTDLDDAGCELVVLPDEPYRFTAGDGPEAFPDLPAALVSGRHLTWYGPSLVQAPAVLARALRAAG